LNNASAEQQAENDGCGIIHIDCFVGVVCMFCASENFAFEGLGRPSNPNAVRSKDKQKVQVMG
jgi:hypothetical protein